MSSRRSWWLMFSAGAAVVAAVLAWLTVTLLRLEQAELKARANASHQENIRLALWRLDSWLSPQIAREASRPYFEYLSYYPQERSYTRLLNQIDPGEVLTPSPLLTYRSELFPIHFQVDASGQVTSPQVPIGNQRDLAEVYACSGPEIDAQQTALTAVRQLIEPGALAAKVEQTEGRLMKLMQPAPGQSAPGDEAAPWIPQVLEDDRQDAASAQTRQTIMEYNQRAQRANIAQQEQKTESNMPAGPMKDSVVISTAVEHVAVGPLVPIWVRHDAGDEKVQLLFLRRVRIAQGEFLQGFLVNWPRLRESLLAQVRDLFTSPRLMPLLQHDQSLQMGMALATIPALLEDPDRVPPQCPTITSARITIALAWLAMLGALPTAAIALRSSIAYGQKRSRFASAVTHELRTPLTTFRMYSEMLADGMVTEPAKRQEYLDMLKRSSLRLATLVENVLAYARIEDGRSFSRAKATNAGELLDRLVPALERRAADAGMTLEVDMQLPHETPLMLDADAVGQILFNLVDNACKYAAQSSDRRIHLAITAGGGELQFSVCDHGPGVRHEHARIIFEPFERGAHQPGDTIPGVGLGLALSRELARDMGGDLVLRESDTAGACFELRGRWIQRSAVNPAN